jgi:hypothetical protein
MVIIILLSNKMDFPQLIIDTCENYKDVTLFPNRIEKSKDKIRITYDIIPIKYLDKKYLISLAFPYYYDKINVESNSTLYSINLIHISYELNLSIFSSEDYNDEFYQIEDFKYTIPLDKYDNFKFINSTEKKLIDIDHIDYIFENFNNPMLPPFAYLSCQSESIYEGAILVNLLNKSIYGIVDSKPFNIPIVIPSIAIKRLLDGLTTNFEYTNFFCDYELYESVLSSGIKIINSEYDDIRTDEVIIKIENIVPNEPIQNLKMITVDGNPRIHYEKINEYVPIEVYMWYEWLPSTVISIETYYMGVFGKKYMKFIDYKEILNTPIFIQEENKESIKFTYRLYEYFAEKNIILDNDIIKKAMDFPYNKKYQNIYLDINNNLINLKCEDFTNFPVNLANI